MENVSAYWYLFMKSIYKWDSFGSHLKKMPFHFWVDTLCALLIAANNAGLGSRQQLQALHQWNNRLHGKRGEEISHKEKYNCTGLYLY